VVHDILKTRKDAEFEIVDIEDYKLPLLDEPLPPTMHQYSNAHTKTWSEKIASLERLHFCHPRIQPCHLGGTSHLAATFRRLICPSVSRPVAAAVRKMDSTAASLALI
jgi:hypothetical protein